MKSLKEEKYSSYRDNIWGVYLADMQLISEFNNGIKFLLYVIGVFSKCAWIIPLNDKIGAAIINLFQSILNDSKRKPNTIWVDKGSEFYNGLMKLWPEKYDIELYSTHNERKSVVPERFTRTLKSRVYQYMTSISKICILTN